MKKNCVFLFAVLFFSLPGFTQKYKSGADSVKLNKEWVKVSNEVAELTSKLTIAQNNLPAYQSKTNEADVEAQATALKSSEQAYKATNGDLEDAKTAKKKAKKASDDAQDAADAKDGENDQEKKIAKLNSELVKKQSRLDELNKMRTNIRAMHTTD